MDIDVRIEDNTDKIKELAREQMLVALEKVGLQAERDVKTKMARYSPKPIVDTGRLMNSITHETDTDEMVEIVGTNVEYAPYVEYGTSKTKAKPFLKNTIQDNMSQYMAIVEDSMKE